MAEIARYLHTLLSSSQNNIAQSLLSKLQKASDWNSHHPVLLLDRCWLRLEQIAVGQLIRVLPPDSSCEMPELVRYRELTNLGIE